MFACCIVTATEKCANTTHIKNSEKMQLLVVIMYCLIRSLRTDFLDKLGWLMYLLT